jgi:hypothetical protein
MHEQPDVDVLAGIPSSHERGVQLGRKLFREFKPRFRHSGDDGETHFAPRELCLLCESIVGIRFSLINGEGTEEQMALLVNALEQAPPRDAVQVRNQKEQAARLADMLWEGEPKTLHELMEGSSLSRASVFRAMKRMGATKIGGTGRNRGRFQCRVSDVPQSRGEQDVQVGGSDNDSSGVC